MVAIVNSSTSLAYASYSLRRGISMQAATTKSIYVSVSSGYQWIAADLPQLDWTTVAIDGIGEVFAAAASGVGVYVSTSQGQAWNLALASTESWYGISMSQSGNQLLASTTTGQLWIADVVGPTLMPTPKPGGGGNSGKPPFDLSSLDTYTVLLSLIPAVLLLSVTAVGRWLRSQRYTADISIIRPLGAAFLEVFLQSITWFFFSEALRTHTKDSQYSTLLLILSKTPILYAWAVLSKKLFIPSSHRLDPSGSASRSVSEFSITPSQIELRSLLHTPSLLGKHWGVALTTWYSVLIFLSLLDLRLLCYLPWVKTPFTDMSDGYPNLFTSRYVLYSSLSAGVLQIGASILLLVIDADNDNLAPQVLFVVFSFLNVLRSSYQVGLFFLVFDLISREEDSANQKMHSVGGDIEFRHSVFKKSSVEEMEEKEEDLVVHQMAEATLTTFEVAHVVINPIAPQPPKPPPKAVKLEPEEEEEKEDPRKEHKTKTRHADETLDILRGQLKNMGARPLEYITLKEIQRELDGIIASARDGAYFDEGRLDYLLMCMELNPEYVAQKEEEKRRWREQVQVFSQQCLEEMRGYIPPQIFSLSEKMLVEDFLINPALAKRIITKKCLWLLRIHPGDIERLHEAELLGRFNPAAHNLDLVELAAIYATLPEVFPKDPLERKKKWRESVEGNLKSMLEDKEKGKLRGAKLRVDCYTLRDRIFADRFSLHTMQAVAQDAERTSFLDVLRNRNNHSVDQQQGTELTVLTASNRESSAQSSHLLLSAHSDRLSCLMRESVYATPEEMLKEEVILEAEGAGDAAVSALFAPPAPVPLAVIREKAAPNLLQNILGVKNGLRPVRRPGGKPV